MIYGYGELAGIIAERHRKAVIATNEKINDIACDGLSSEDEQEGLEYLLGLSRKAESLSKLLDRIHMLMK